jgi:hypothetical protein
MKILDSKFKYDDYMDKEVVELCNAINALSSIQTMESCCGHGKDNFKIFLKVDNKQEGLFFLTRCVDRRYWKYGYLWKIELCVGDAFYNNRLPLIYTLHSGDIIGEEAYNQSQSLVENMNYHLNHKNFIKHYCLDINLFKYKEL